MSAAVTGTSGAAGAGTAAGSVTTAGGASAGAGAGAVATAGCACLVSVEGAEAGAPGTPPVTLIESSPDSSLAAGCGADADGGAEFAGVLRIESPTVGAATPSCAHAGNASANPTSAVATMRAARLTLLGFFTIFLRHDFSLNLRMKLEDARLGMPAQSDSSHL